MKNKVINLWDMMLYYAKNHPMKYKADEADAAMVALSSCARLPMQELSLQSSPDGWIIHIFSTFDEYRHISYQIRIPSDMNVPPMIVGIDEKLVQGLD
jgi:hypothetical protein